MPNEILIRKFCSLHTKSKKEDMITLSFKIREFLSPPIKYIYLLVTHKFLFSFTQTINERLEAVNAPFILVEGYVDIVHLIIPWKELHSKSIVVEIDGLMLTVQLKEEELG